jgi:hypothetical protein
MLSLRWIAEHVFGEPVRSARHKQLQVKLLLQHTEALISHVQARQLGRVLGLPQLGAKGVSDYLGGLQSIVRMPSVRALYEPQQHVELLERVAAARAAVQSAAPSAAAAAGSGGRDAAAAAAGGGHDAAAAVGGRGSEVRL